MLAVILLACISLVRSAPLEQGAAASSDSLKQAGLKPLQPLREYLILTPEAQLQLQPAFKLRQSVIQPLALYGASTSTRQFENICNQIQQGIEGFQEVVPITLPWFETDKDDGTKKLNAQQQMPELNSDAETIDQSMLPKTPAATFPIPEHRFYTVSGRPQFFGNVDILQNPLHPIFSLQPLQAIKARSVADPVIELNQDALNQAVLNQASQALPLALQETQEIRQEELPSANAESNLARAFEERVIKNLDSLEKEQLNPETIIPAEANAEQQIIEEDSLLKNEPQLDAEPAKPEMKIASAKSNENVENDKQQEQELEKLASPAAIAEVGSEQDLKLAQEELKNEAPEK